jgi:hypothetical protein
MTDGRHGSGQQDTDPPIWTAPELEPVRRTQAPDATIDTGAAVSAGAEAGVASASRSSGPGRLRVGLVAGAAVALAVGAVATSMAASPAPSTSGTPIAAPAAAAQALDPVIDEESDDLDHRGPGGFRDITISAISGSNVTLKTADGWTRTIAITSSVELSKGGQAIEVSDLKVGDSVRFSQTRNADGTYTVTDVVVVVPTVSGTVKDITSTGFTLTARGGSVWTIATSAATVYTFGSGTGSKADVVAGAAVRVQGESTGDNKLAALSVRVAADRTVGTVTAKTSNTITIRTRDGSTRTIHVDAGTTYRVRGVENADLGDVAVDMIVGVEGRARADGSIDADVVGAGRLRGGNGDGPGKGWGRGDKNVAPSASPSTSS